jgi:hypothetical protein
VAAQVGELKVDLVRRFAQFDGAHVRYIVLAGGGEKAPARIVSGPTTGRLLRTAPL